MKTCTKCNKEKPLGLFAWKNKKRGKKSSVCKECQKKYAKNHHKNNKQYYLDKAKKSRDKSRSINRKFIRRFLIENPCSDCGESNPIVLEFDHQRDKKGNISEMIFNSSLKKLKEEVDKCEVVCANCHKIRTAKQFNFYQDLD